MVVHKYHPQNQYSAIPKGYHPLQPCSHAKFQKLTCYVLLSKRKLCSYEIAVRTHAIEAHERRGIWDTLCSGPNLH